MGTFDEERRLSAQAILGFVTEALDDVPRRIVVIEALAANLAADAHAERAVRVALQDLDLIRQTVEDVARAASLAREANDTNVASLVASLRLEALRKRLLGTLSDEALTDPCPGIDGAGRVEFFGNG